MEAFLIIRFFYSRILNIIQHTIEAKAINQSTIRIVFITRNCESGLKKANTIIKAIDITRIVLQIFFFFFMSLV